MGKTLTLEPSDDADAVLRRRAEAVGTSPARLAAVELKRQLSVESTHDTGSKKPEARDRFERHFGEVDVGRATGVDNEAIDADLAREYAERAFNKTPSEAARWSSGRSK
jgi:hypothetical protein